MSNYSFSLHLNIGDDEVKTQAYLLHDDVWVLKIGDVNVFASLSQLDEIATALVTAILEHKLGKDLLDEIVELASEL